MIKVIYAPNGEVISDFKIEEFLEGIAAESDKEVCVSNELVIHGIRAWIHLGKIDYRNVVFVYNDEHIYPSASGRLSNWPDGFCNFFDKYIDILIGLNGGD